MTDLPSRPSLTGGERTPLQRFRHPLRLWAVMSLALATSLAACGTDEANSADEWVWDLPAHFPIPVIPDDNPMSAAKVELGRYLFYDTRLSLNETQACASCHEQSSAFTDGRGNAMGSTGELHPRSAMALGNVAFNASLNWSNPLITELESQALGPLFGEHPVELGMSGQEDLLVSRLASDADYPRRFADAFPEAGGEITINTIAKALSAFERSLISADAPYDRFLAGDADALSDSAKRGMRLFFSEGMECFHCHGGFNFTDSNNHSWLPFSELAFHNTGLYNIDGEGAYPADNTGLIDISGRPEDMGRFRSPTLRNIALTAPYFHDGSAATLDEVIDHYAAGGRRITEGPYAGDGSTNPLKNAFVSGFSMDEQGRADLIAFLESLTDEAFITNPAHSDPFQ